MESIRDQWYKGGSNGHWAGEDNVRKVISLKASVDLNTTHRTTDQPSLKPSKATPTFSLPTSIHASEDGFYGEKSAIHRFQVSIVCSPAIPGD